MPGEAWERGGRIPLVLVAAGLIVVSPAAAGLTETAETPPASLAENDSHPETDLLAPLLKLAQSPQERHALHTAYVQGQAWTDDRLAHEGDLPSAVDALYGALGLDAGVHAEPVPEAFRAPLAALVTLQAHHTAQSGPYASLTKDASQAFTLGALSPVIDALEEANHDAPEDPVFVDPLGLIVLGGSGDNAYHPQPVGPTTWEGSLLVVEPAGNDTYNEPVAAPFTVDRSQLPGPGDILSSQLASIALEMGGNDTYNNRTASADLGGPSSQAVLIDQQGNDRYGTTGIERTTAHASPGFAYLLDEEGNDAYRAHSRGIAQSARAGKAILWDQQGNDTYTASNQRGTVFTHGMAHGREAKALLWDETGDDTYRATLFAYASVFNDGVARLVDEQGDDAYRIGNVGFSFGNRSITLHSPFVDRASNRGLGEFTDGNGDDTYDWNRRDSGDPLPENDKTRIDHGEDLKYGVFIDCETPDDADRPCEEQQREAHCTVLRNTGFLPAPIEGLLDPVLDDAKQACLEHAP